MSISPSQKKKIPSWGERTYVMGILNITEDSFSGDGLLNQGNIIDLAVEQAGKYIAGGADILDIGGESTRPGAQTITADVELERVLPVLKAISRKYPNVIISIDTYKSEVAKEALESGADWINDVWGLQADPQMAEVAAKHDAVIVLMHNRSKLIHAEINNRLGGRYTGIETTDLMTDVNSGLIDCVSLAHAAGISDQNIILDPGIGFGKTVEQNLELIDRLGELRSLEYPILLGVSRKSFIGYTLNLPPDQRLEGTAAAVAVGITRGADIVRVHDVDYMARVARMTDAMVRRK
jgi:dihydropteroate synthase